MAKRRKKAVKRKVDKFKAWAAAGFNTAAFESNVTAISAYRKVSLYEAAIDMGVGTSSIYNQIADGRMLDLPTLLKWSVYYKADINVLIRRLYAPYDDMLGGEGLVTMAVTLPDTPKDVHSASKQQQKDAEGGNVTGADDPSGVPKPEEGNPPSAGSTSAAFTEAIKYGKTVDATGSRSDVREIELSRKKVTAGSNRGGKAH